MSIQLPELSRAPLSTEGAMHPSPFFAVEFDPATRELLLLDQLKLPNEVAYRRLAEPDEAAEAIREMVVRGAPAIGITAAYALAMTAARVEGDAATFLLVHGGACRVLGNTRPTAVNLAWAISRMSRTAADAAKLAPKERYQRMLDEAESIHREDLQACRAMGALGALDVPQKATILTHCNTGALATGGFGTALGVIRAAREAGKEIRVLASETRPYLQGARLTSWELHQDGIEVEVITDNMVGHFLKQGEVDFVVVGSDRIAKNGDVANKIGTYGLAVLANHHGVPFTVAAPWSTVDIRTATGDSIPIEERSRGEVAEVGNRTLVAEGIGCRHPAFDITPASLIDAIYTERGKISPKQGEMITSL